MDGPDAGSAGPAGDLLVVATFAAEHNFVSLPAAHANALVAQGAKLPAVLRLRRQAAPQADGDVLVAWQGAHASRTDVLELPAALAKASRLADGAAVAVTLAELPVARTVHASVASVDDWTVLETNAEQLVTEMLKQTKVVRTGDIIPVWIRGQSAVDLCIDACDPSDAVVLENSSTICIAPAQQPPAPEQAAPAADAPAAAPEAASPPPAQAAAVPTASGARARAKPGSSGAASSAAVGADRAVAGAEERIQLPVRLRVREWEELGDSLTISLDGPKIPSAFTMGLLVGPALMRAAGISPGQFCALNPHPHMVRPHAADAPVLPAFAHGAAEWGHIYVARATMRHLGLTKNSQAWLDKQGAERGFLWTRSLPPTVSVCRMVPLDSAADLVAGLAELRRGGSARPAQDLQALVETFEQHKCTELLNAAALEHTAEDLRQALGKEEASMAAADSTTLLLGSRGDVGSAHAALRHLLAAWIQAHMDYVRQVLPSDGAASGRALALPASDAFKTPRRGVLVLEPSDDLEAAASFLVDWKVDSSSATACLLDPTHLKNSEALRVLPDRAAKLPQLVDTGAWQPPEHARRRARAGAPAAAAAAEQQLLPAAGSRWLDPEMSRMLQIVMPYLALRAQSFWKGASMSPPGSILVTGPRGSGKTALLEAFATYVTQHPATMCHVSWVRCLEFAGDKLKRAAKRIQGCILTALERAPAVVIFDNVDALVPFLPEHVPAQDKHMIEFQNEFLINVFDWTYEQVHAAGSQVVLVASTSDPASLPKAMRMTGRLEHLIQVGTPSSSVRLTMLQHALDQRSLKATEADLQHVVRKTEGYEAADLAVLVDRTWHGAYVDRLAQRAGQGAASEELLTAHWDAALAQVQPSATWEAGAQKGVADSNGWKDVGGMAAARDALYEAIELPLRFAKLLASAPLRLRTGVMLYGPPGCGKTHVVRAAVGAAGVRFIGVKGPELMNKYVGESEAAIRAVFARAQSAAPCVLFFDEFDSIAPKRGSGSDWTGVTERMVNQLLTELDGVEALQGVCVIAASNRPDLVDTALLRPGRLDRLIYCGFPDDLDRKLILQSHLAKTHVEDGIDVDAIATSTEGYSGADLGALVSEAQLNAVMARCAQLEAQGGGNPARQQEPESREHVVVRKEDVAVAMRKTRPSIGKQERSKMEENYRRFMLSREGKGRTFSSRGESSTMADQNLRMAVA